MSTRVRKNTDSKKVVRFKRKRRIRGRVIGSSEKPRMAVFRSNAHMYVQLIDDGTGATVVSVSTLEKSLKGKCRNNVPGAKELGRIVAERAKEKKIERVVFDRAGYLYHGRIKALADSAREAGLHF